MQETNNNPTLTETGKKQLLNDPKAVFAVIIPMRHRSAGLAGMYMKIVNCITLAIYKGYIPVVDLKHVDWQYFKEGRILKDNAWEYYFKQPAGITLEDLSNITDNSKIRTFSEPYQLQNVYDPDEKLPSYTPFENYIKYMQLSDYALEYAENYRKKTIGEETDVLGIYCRGTDYLWMRPRLHHIPATPQMLIEKAKELKKKYNYKKVYVATEDLEIYNKFKEEFQDDLVPNLQYKYNHKIDSKTLPLSDVKVERKDHHYWLGLEYLASMYVLSKCKYFIASNYSAGVVFVKAMSSGYKNMEYAYVYDRGCFKVRHKIQYNKLSQRLFSVKHETYENIVWKVITILGIKIKFIKKIK